MRERKGVQSFVFMLILVVLGLSCGVMSSQAQPCDNSLWIKSIWPAVIELDPYTLRIKDSHSFWEITKSNASPYGDYAWGLSGIPTDQGPDLYYLHTTSNYSGSSSIYRINLETGKSTSYQALSVVAYGLAQKGNNFYIVYYDNYQMKSVVARVGGEKVALP